MYEKKYIKRRRRKKLSCSLLLATQYPLGTPEDPPGILGTPKDLFEFSPVFRTPIPYGPEVPLEK